MPVQAATFGQTNFNTAAGASQYKGLIDADFSALTRLGDCFAPHQGTTPSMNVYLDPGFALAGTSLLEKGTYTTATFSSGATTATVANPAGISGTMWIADNQSNTYIPAGTTCTIVGSTLTLSNATLQAGSSIPVVLGQITAAFVAPVTHPRIDRVVVNGSTGAVSVITGTENASPVAPSLTAGVLPCAQVLLQTTSTSILNTMITDERAIGGGSGTNNTEATVASASTTDIGATNVNAILITGTTTITSFGSNGNTTNPYYFVRFSGALTLTYNGTSLTLPGKNNITTIAGDRAVFQYMGSGNWQCVQYIRASGAPVIEGPTATIASATTTDLGSAGVTTLTISGTTTITGLGSSATLDNPLYFITFSGALTLTYNATSLIVPGQANITTAANDTAVAQYLGSGNWQIVSYTKVAGSASQNLKRNAQSSTYAPAATDLSEWVDFTGSSNATWTFTAASTLGNGWFCYIRNSGTSNAILTLASSGGNLDGVSGYVMYPGEERLFQCDGTNFNSLILKPFAMLFTSSGSLTIPPGYKTFQFDVWSSGQSGAVRATTGDSGGGAGGNYSSFILPSSAFVSAGSTETITIGAASASVASSNANGNLANLSSFTVNGTAIPPSLIQTAAANSVTSANGAAGGIINPIAAASTLSATWGNQESNAQGGIVSSADVCAAGNKAIYSGGGGGSSSSISGGTRTGGTSLLGGAGGAGGANSGSSPGTGGTAPSGGGGGAVEGGASGAGAKGQIIARGIN